MKTERKSGLEHTSAGALLMKSDITSIREAMQLLKSQTIISPFWHRQMRRITVCGSNMRMYTKK